MTAIATWNVSWPGRAGEARSDRVSSPATVERPTMNIAVLDVRSEGLETRKVHSNAIVDLLEESLPPDHRCCRWINIKQPSPDAISILREHTGLERLGTYKEVSKTLLRWDSSSNGYVGVPFPMLHLDPFTNVPNEPRAVSSLQKEMIQEFVYVLSNSDNKVVTISDIADCDMDASVKAILSRSCSSRQMLHASSMLSAVICSVVGRSVAMAITCLERVKTLELHVLTQPEEQHIQDIYLILVSIRRVQRSLRTEQTKRRLDTYAHYQLKDDIPVPTPGDGELLMRVKASRFCHADYQVYQGVYSARLSFTGSHEPVGVIAALGPNFSGDWAVGDRVGVLNFPNPCGFCAGCRWRLTKFVSLDARFCENKIVGGLCGYMIAVDYALVMLPDSLSFEQATSLMCAGATSWNAIRQCQVKPGETLAVFGIGGLGVLEFSSQRLLACESQPLMAVMLEPELQPTYQVILSPTSSASYTTLILSRNLIIFETTWELKLLSAAPRIYQQPIGRSTVSGTEAWVSFWDFRMMDSNSILSTSYFVSSSLVARHTAVCKR
ncbi:hypothetical protein NCS56_01225300 [Fusarium sp. Ph1]|nr:hypothetical protein NCS56_01225300 [Fusarium sp. Ph1]